MGAVTTAGIQQLEAAGAAGLGQSLQGDGLHKNSLLAGGAAMSDHKHARSGVFLFSRSSGGAATSDPKNAGNIFPFSIPCVRHRVPLFVQDG